MTINEIRDKLKETGYIPTDDICYAVFGMLALNKPLLVEGAPGVGKTSLAKALAEVMGLPMLRLQMYDGLTKDEVLYDYDYQRQLLTLEAVKPKLNEEIKDLGINDAIKHVAGDVDFYGKEFLIPRPVLQTIDGSGRKLLLIDEIDKASEETEYMLYEYLEDYSIDIPQFGTVSCPEDQKPVVILTSNAYRELSGAMKRRCSYLYIKKKTRAEIIEVLKYRTSVDERIEKNDWELCRSADDLKRQEREFKKKLKQIAKQQKEIFKDKPVESRKETLRLKNAVHSRYQGDVCLDKKFSKMSAEEKLLIYDYIRENARKFRTKLNRKIRTNRASKIDIPATVKKSCQTGGIPLCLIHQKPIRQKSNLILILDVSGSCKEASELMLVFMHAMKEVFPGGCSTYAFTNKLYDISEFMEMDDAAAAVSEVLKAIPRSGAYSNYELPFRTFYNSNMSKVTGDSYVYIIGDARNNKNRSGEEYVKAIARKAKKAFWLNTEEMSDWNTGDSIIGTYAKYMTKVAQTTTAAELLGFLES